MRVKSSFAVIAVVVASVSFIFAPAASANPELSKVVVYSHGCQAHLKARYDGGSEVSASTREIRDCSQVAVYIHYHNKSGKHVVSRTDTDPSYASTAAFDAKDMIMSMHSGWNNSYQSIESLYY